MRIELIGKNTLYKISLPQVKQGNYWITDEGGNKLLNIEGKNGKWKIASNELYKIIDSKYVTINENGIIVNQDESKVIIDEILLKEYDCAYVYIEKLREMFILYALPVYENNLNCYDIEEMSRIIIGSDDSSDIIYKRNFVSKNHSKIVFSNGRWVIENLDKIFGTFVNDMPVSKTTRVLLNGDIIIIMGLKIIIIGKKLYINNPLKNIKVSNKLKKIEVDNDEKYFDIDDDDIVVDNDETYYSRTPRIITKIEREQVKIDPPPMAQNNEKMPAILAMGSSMMMGLMSVMSMMNTINGIATSGFNFGSFIGLLMSAAMLGSMIVIPSFQRKFEEKQRKKYEEKRQKRYRKYIDEKIKEIDDITVRQKNILTNNYLSADECSNVIIQKSPRLWERKIDNFDFLTVRLGTGDVPLEIDISYPQKSFSMEDDEFMDMVNEIGNKSKILKNAPVVLSLAENNITGIISKDEEISKRFVRNLILQLVTFHSYTDLKIVFLLKDDTKKRWEYLKMLPHVWSNAKDVRFFTDNYDEMREVSLYLEESLHDRFEIENLDYRKCSPYYLIITDDYRKVENLKIISSVVKSKINVGVSLLCMADSLTNLPDDSKTFINLEDGKGVILESEMIATKQKKFIFDSNERLFFEKILQVISNNPIKYNSSGVVALPSVYTFLQMYDVGTVEELNVLDRWRKNDSTLSLRAPIGIDTSGTQVVLDVHEKFYGPHGLVAGSTGSGKSEFLMTYILSLAVNFHPNDVSFVLIDYKGGGLAGAFKKGNIVLPHLAGTITNIDTAGLRRSLASIQSELRRRQIIFNIAREKTNEGTIDIYKYQKLFHDGIVKEPIPHLLIICDEFAELKQQQPEFMEELISVSRIGRSLGVHLILATQKPAGIVNDQIRSNSKFSVCLKVQDKQDSFDVIKRPDAANLKNVGQFYMSVGNDDYFVLGQSAWSGAGYFPSEGTKKKEDTSIEFISSIGNLLKKVDDSLEKTSKSKGEQLTNIVKYIYNLARSENVKERQLWLDSIPETIYLEDVKQKYMFLPTQDIVSVYGEYDDPYNQRQGLAELKISNGGNVLIYGSADSGKETLLSTIVYDVITTYSSNKIWLYILDFGTEVLKIFKNAPHVGDVVLMGNDEKIDRFFAMIQNEILRRRKILFEYGGDYNLYVKSGNEMPIITVIVNNYEGFNEYYQDKYDDILLNITREGIKCGIMFIMTVSAYSSVRYRLGQNFKERIALRLNNDDDYFNILDNIGKKRPSNLFGRGLVNIDGNCFEFQTAKICESTTWNSKIKETIEVLNSQNTIKANKIPMMPDKVTFDDVKEFINDIKEIPVGVKRNDLNLANYNFVKNFVNIITTKNLDDTASFIIELIKEFEYLKNVNLSIIDAERIIKTKKTDFKNDYEKFINLINSDNNDQNICIIIGADKLINELDSAESALLQMLKIAERKENYNFIIIDRVSKLKDHEYDEWYKSFVSGEDGIWIGNGIDDQYLIKKNINDRSIVNNCGSDFGYIINQSEATLIKLIGAN